MRNPKFTKRNLPSVFNFKVNPRILQLDDFDLLYTIEKDSVGDVWICYFKDPIDFKIKTTMYHTKDVLEYVNGYSWLVEGFDFAINCDDFEVSNSDADDEDVQYYNDYLGF